MRQSTRTTKYSEKFLEWQQSLAKQATLSSVSAETQEVNTPSPSLEPSSYLEAISCADSKYWIPAIFEEYDSLLQNGTWTLCRLPPNRKAIEGKWVMKFKPSFKSTSARYKARFVIKGYSQVFGLDYTETYAPVAKNYSLRLILAIATAKNLEMIQLDVKTAFLYGTLDEEIYMKQPEGFVIPGKEQEVCRLVKIIYGLKQASRVWNIKFNEFVIKCGLTRSQADPCIYYRHLRLVEAEEELTIFILYVDDGLILSNIKSHWKALKRILAYLKKAINFGLLFGGGSSEICGYCDSDYAGDLESRRFTSGAVFTLHNGSVSWFSRRQTCVALSTTETEFFSAAEGTKEGIWLKHLHLKLGATESATPLRCDNQGAIALIHDPVFHHHTKHMDVRFFFIRDAQQEGRINVSYIETESQLADIFTKALAVPRFEKLRKELNICELSESNCLRDNYCVSALGHLT